MQKHKTLGQVFTPNWIVEEILKSVGFVGKNILNKKIIDPACGDGAFLKIIVLKIIDKCIEKKYLKSEIIRILENNVYGIEIDKIEFKNCVDNLNEITANKLNENIKINWKIFQDNTLKKYTEFINFFDFVVGNPPYIRIHNLDKETRNIVKKEFIFSEGTIDMYLSFFELGFKLLNRKGVLGYITPNSYLHNSSYINFRKFLKEKKIVKSLLDFKANKIFQNFSTYTAITIIDFSRKNTDSFQYKELIKQNIKVVNEIKYSDLLDNDWSFSNIENMNFLSKLYNNNRNKKVNDFFDVQYGFATLRDKIFINEIQAEKNNLVLFNNKWIEKNLLFKIVKASTFKGDPSQIKYIIFPYKKINNRFIVIPENELKIKHPKTYKYFLENKEELLNRDIDKNSIWYEFGRSQGIQTSFNKKIIVSTLMKDYIKYYEINEDVFVYSGIFIIKKNRNSDWEVIKNVLSSKDFTKYIRITGKDFSGGYKSITSKQIKNYPTNKLNLQNPLFTY